jgi:hypothetical protein
MIVLWAVWNALTGRGGDLAFADKRVAFGFSPQSPSPRRVKFRALIHDYSN